MMKKMTVLMGLTIGGTLLMGTSNLSAAADYPITTQGTIEWTAPTGPGQVVKPELPPEVTIKPEGGNQTSGSLRIQYVPNFDFGKQEIKTGAQQFNPKFEAYAFTGQLPSGAASGTKYYMPQFIQVTDERGTNSGWNLTVKATTFKNGEEELAGAKITLNGGAKLSNTVHSDAEIANRVATFTGADGAESLVIPTDGTATEKVMATETDTKVSTTNGTQTSLVLSKDYDKDELASTAASLNQGVTFNKPNTDVAVIGTYTSTVTWTLADGI